MAELLKGIDVVRAVSEELKLKADALKEAGITPCLCVIRAGNRDDDVAYLAGIEKRCGIIGIEVKNIVLDETATTGEAVAEIEKAGADSGIHGILIMRPMPKHIDDGAICKALDPKKDVDGITDLAMADVFAGRQGAFAPCTAEACIELLDYYKIDVRGKNVTVIGRSLVIGKPLALMLIKRDATITVCHTKTRDMREVCRRADIVVAAAGVPKMVDASYLCEGQTVIDVGINVDADGKLCGDVDFDSASDVVTAITPVPGGVGTVTSTILARHVIQAAESKNN